VEQPPSSPEFSLEALREYLDPIVHRYEKIQFIDLDPISILHGFDNPADREIIGLFSALLAWGRRDLLLRKLGELCERMRFRPYEFVSGFNADRDSGDLSGFVHRTFNSEDAIWLCIALREVLQHYGSLEKLFVSFINPGTPDLGPALEGLSRTLLQAHPEMPRRMSKHLARPSTGSACKRLCLYLRWMVRPGPVDLNVWPSIDKKWLFLPIDVHSGRQARAVGLLYRNANDWKAVQELTRACRKLNVNDPARYDFAFFGTGAAGETLTLPDDAQ